MLIADLRHRAPKGEKYLFDRRAQGESGAGVRREPGRIVGCALFTSQCRFHRVGDASNRLHRRKSSAQNDRND
jgi:hypothetical protein